MHIKCSVEFRIGWFLDRFKNGGTGFNWKLDMFGVGSVKFEFAVIKLK